MEQFQQQANLLQQRADEAAAKMAKGIVAANEIDLGTLLKKQKN